MTDAPEPSTERASYDGPKTPNTPVDTNEALGAEDLLLGQETRRTALCLSGGGIRSAAFCLGVIQALAARGLLKQFRYLSTVSGGGYIGGWLTRLIADSRPDGNTPADLASIEKALSSQSGFEQLNALRRYTNYLNPKLGPGSADLWAGIVLWLRNTIINWFVFAPLLIAIVCLPILYFGLVALASTMASVSDKYAIGIELGLGWAALICLCITIVRSVVNLPSFKHPDVATPNEPKEAFGPTDGDVIRKIVAPALVWCLLAPVAFAPAIDLREAELRPDIVAVFAPEPPAKEPETKSCRATIGDRMSLMVAVAPDKQCPVPPQPDETRSRQAEPFLAILAASATFVTGLLAYLLAFLEVRLSGSDHPDRPRRKMAKPFRVNALAWVTACAASSALIWLGLHLAAGQSLLWLVIGGPPWVLLTEILRSTVFVAFRRDAVRGDLDREWLGRLSGLKLSFGAIALGVGLAVLLLPSYLLTGPIAWSAILGGGAASGTAAALIGKSARTAISATKPDGSRWVPTITLAEIAIVVFLVALIMAVGRCATALLWQLTAWPPSAAWDVGTVLATLSNIAFDAAALSAAGFWLAFKLGEWINLNNFSMHAVYRNRLVRAFLGTSRKKGAWQPDRFTHFDPNDDVRMFDTFPTNAGKAREPLALFPVINVALNTTSGKDMARAERKASSFTISPLHCGSATLIGPHGEGDPAEPRGAYAETRCYASGESETGPTDKRRGISLGTAITISGAAASPNMGYHSSSLVAFIMTLFNVRLGAWLPNPAARMTSLDYLENPDADSIKPILAELAGRSDDRGKYLYLSDGGHFDNLALYEMIRRKCEFIVVVDAGQDEDYAYADLRRAIQNAAIDLKAKIVFEKQIKIGNRALDPIGAYAKVSYEQPANLERQQFGTILYLKPWLSDESPTELLAFKAERKHFPHETTGNQFFGESDFESYRHLGQYITATVIQRATVDTQPDLATVFAGLESALTPSGPRQPDAMAQHAQSIARQLAGIARSLNRPKR